MAREQLSLTINGTPVRVPAGTTLLQALRELGVHVPTLCHDERLTPYGGCRICVVARRDGRGGLVPACATPVQQGMVIETDTPEVVESRRRQLQLLALDHRMDCPVCERRGDCRLQDLLSIYGSPSDELPLERRRAARDVRSRVIVRDPEKCILCGRCVRICDEVQGVAELGIVERGPTTRVGTFLERPLDCEFCGQCVNACPVGALIARPYTSEIPVWQREVAVTTCSYCSCGCQIAVERHEGTLLRVTSDVSALPNHGKLCAKGWLGWDVLDDAERLETPLVRRGGRLVRVEWDEALEAVAVAVREARDAGRPVVGLGSPRLTCEDAYLMQRLVRAVYRSPHVDVGPVGGVAALVEGMGRATGRPDSSATFEDLAAADAVLVVRGDPTRTHPLVKTELVQGIRQRGQQLILAHALSGGLERHARLCLTVRPGTEEIFVHGVAAEVLHRRPSALVLHRDVPGFREWCSSVSDYTPELVSSCTGVPAASIVEAAEILARARSVVSVVVTGLGIPGDEASATRATVWLTSILGVAAANRGVLVLGEKANVQGVLDMGLHPGLLPGHVTAKDDAALDELERSWGAPLPAGPGWTTAESFARAARGEVGVLHLAGQDPVGAWPQRFHPRKAIEGAGVVVVQDAFRTRTARLADIVLPVRILGDRDGTLVGADGVRRRLSRVRTRPRLPQDGQLFAELARRLGSRLPQGEELEGVLQGSLRWPHGKVPVARFEAICPPIGRCEWSGMLLDVSPQLFHSGSVTRRSRRLQELSATVAARLCPDDARELGVQGGDAIRVSTDEGELLLRARLDRTVRPGTLVVPWQTGGGDSAAVLVSDPERPVAVHVRRSR
jgi:formate dehydrogenase alpha subunit